MKSELLFVYGTLRKKAAADMHHWLVRHARYYSAGQMSGELYEVAGYPGALATVGNGRRISGELYKIIDAESVLPTLDEYEECTERFPKPHEFIREKRPVTLPDGKQVLAWVYLYNRNTAQLERIDSGDYLLYAGEKAAKA